MRKIGGTKLNWHLSLQSEKVWFGGFFLTATVATIVLLNLSHENAWLKPAFNLFLSIGTSGVVAFIFYYVVNSRLDKRRAELVREANARAYRIAKRHIAYSVIFASQKGGRDDLQATSETIDSCLNPTEFREIIGSGSRGDEGFYAFQNQMSDRTHEFEEIVFNLKTIEAAAERMIISGTVLSEDIYNRLVGLSAVIRRIEHQGAGYDESKALCQFIWEMFAGWNWKDGQLDHDPIERIFKPEE